MKVFDTFFRLGWEILKRVEGGALVHFLVYLVNNLHDDVKCILYNVQYDDVFIYLHQFNLSLMPDMVSNYMATLHVIFLRFTGSWKVSSRNYSKTGSWQGILTDVRLIHLFPGQTVDKHTASACSN